ncbi:9841_t:CDS:2, partial [Entrophospora sp. SA101]
FEKKAPIENSTSSNKISQNGDVLLHKKEWTDVHDKFPHNSSPKEDDEKEENMIEQIRNDNLDSPEQKHSNREAPNKTLEESNETSDEVESENGRDNLLIEQQQQFLNQLNQDDDVLKEAFAYPSIGGNSPPLSPTAKNPKYSSAHSIINAANGVTSLFANAAINPEPRKLPVEPNSKWLYRDPTGNIQGPFTSQEMNDWYKGGFFRTNLLVKRVEDQTFEPLGTRPNAKDDKEIADASKYPTIF